MKKRIYLKKSILFNNKSILFSGMIDKKDFWTKSY